MPASEWHRPAARGHAPATGADRARPVRVGARVKQGRSANDLEVYATEGVSESVWETELQAALGTSSPAFVQTCLPAAQHCLPLSWGGRTFISGHVCRLGRHSVVEAGERDTGRIGGAYRLSRRCRRYLACALRRWWHRPNVSSGPPTPSPRSNVPAMPRWRATSASSTEAPRQSGWRGSKSSLERRPWSDRSHYEVSSR